MHRDLELSNDRFGDLEVLFRTGETSLGSRPGETFGGDHRVGLLEEGSGEIVDLVLDRSTSFLGDSSLSLFLDEVGSESLKLILDV